MKCRYCNNEINRSGKEFDWRFTEIGAPPNYDPKRTILYFCHGCDEKYLESEKEKEDILHILEAFKDYIKENPEEWESGLKYKDNIRTIERKYNLKAWEPREREREHFGLLYQAQYQIN